MYTDYDKLLKEIPWQAARQTVQDATLLKCSEWRGEEGSDDADDAMEDILREVIVISEDEDETDGPHDRLHPRRVDDDEASVIVLDEMETHPINYGALNEEDLQKVMSPEPNDNITFQALGNGQYVISHNDPARDEKNSARRLRTWAETRGRFRRPPQEPEVVYELDPQQPVQRYDRSMRVLVPESVPIGRRDSPRGMARQERTAMTCIPLPRRDFNSGSSILQVRHSWQIY